MVLSGMRIFTIVATFSVRISDKTIKFTTTGVYKELNIKTKTALAVGEKANITVSGLFASGEILDIDGDCGGFNLQWAWSSGFVTGTHAAKS